MSENGSGKVSSPAAASSAPSVVDSTATTPRPAHYIERPDGARTWVIALDELPSGVTITGLEIPPTIEDAQSNTNLGIFPKSNARYEVVIPTGEKVVVNGTGVIAPASGRFTAGRYASTAPYNPVTPGVLGSKVYCTHWIRTGECDFIQQGCMFRHVIPDLSTLMSLGYRSYPRWFREAPRDWQEANAVDFNAVGLTPQANRPWLTGGMPGTEGPQQPILLQRGITAPESHASTSSQSLTQVATQSAARGNRSHHRGGVNSALPLRRSNASQTTSRQDRGRWGPRADSLPRAGANGPDKPRENAHGASMGIEAERPYGINMPPSGPPTPAPLLSGLTSPRFGNIGSPNPLFNLMDPRPMSRASIASIDQVRQYPSLSAMSPLASPYMPGQHGSQLSSQFANLLSGQLSSGAAVNRSQAAYRDLFEGAPRTNSPFHAPRFGTSGAPAHMYASGHGHPGAIHFGQASQPLGSGATTPRQRVEEIADDEAVAHGLSKM